MEDTQPCSGVNFAPNPFVIGVYEGKERIYSKAVIKNFEERHLFKG